MSLPNELLPVGLLATPAGAAGGYSIDRSLRFNSGDSSYLNRTPASAGNRKTWTWAGWIKRSKISDSVDTQFFSAGTSGASNLDAIGFTTTDTINFYSYNGSFVYLYNTSAVFRDTSAWYHVVAVLDTTNATSTDRVRLYVNGVRVTDFASSTAPSQNADGAHINTTNAHYTGKFIDLSQYFNGYLADVHFVDGQALDPTSFGEFDANGVWQPIDASGLTYGTNGFHLDFADNSTDAALGYDAAGSNDWTVNNITVGPAASTGFKAVTYTGNGSTQTIGGVGFSPDLVWVKNRNGANNNVLQDSVRGFGSSKNISSNQLQAEGTDVDGVITGNTGDGFTVSVNGQVGRGTNATNYTYVGWCWDAGDSTASNTDGSITSSLRANQTTGFSVVTWTGTGSNATIGHGLNAVPDLILCKDRGSNNWVVQHSSTGQNYLVLNGTYGSNTDSSIWNAASTTSTFSVGSGSNVNASSHTYVAYCFTSKTGISDFGSYTSSTSTSQKITVGFKPAFVLIKGTFNSSSWVIFDNKRGFSNHLLAESSNDENNPAGIGDLTVDDTGFTIPAAGDNGNIRGGGTYIYAAFAENVNPADIDSLRDSATNGNTANDTGLGGEVPGNYCTWNPLTNGSYTTLSNGNLEATGNTNANNGNSRSTMAVTTGKWYTEMTVSATTANIYPSIGILLATDATTPANAGSSGNQVGYPADSVAYEVSGVKRIANSTSSYGSSYTNGDVIGIAVDADNGAIYFSKNGTWQGSGDPTSGASKTGAAYTWTGGSREYVFGTAHYNGAKSFQNWGQSAFVYSAPSGYKALCTANLDDPTIADGSDYMDVVTYTGNGSTQSISGLEFSPDFVWIKRRNSASDHQLYDIVRGTNNGLSSNLTDTEWNYGNGLTAFNSDGFTLGALGGANALNDSHVAWTWDAGSSTVSNTDGSVTSSVRANATAGFSIVTYTVPSGLSTGDTFTVGHGLNAQPGLVILKERNNVDDWLVGHGTLNPTQQYLLLNSTQAASAPLVTPPGVWGNGITSSVFGQRIGSLSGGGEDCVAYCFAPVEGYSAFGSYEGTGNSDGAFCFTGFRPRYLMLKNADGTYNWKVIDSARSPYNFIDEGLSPNTTSSESSSGAGDAIDFLSNGFKIRAGSSNTINASGNTFVWAAFAENPFKYARAR